MTASRTIHKTYNIYITFASEFLLQIPLRLLAAGSGNAGSGI